MTIALLDATRLNTGATGTPVSATYSVPVGTSLLVCGAVIINPGKTMTTCSYGGNSMTAATSVLDSSNGLNLVLFTLAAPPTGSNSFSLAWTGGGTNGFLAPVTSWSGTSTTGNVITPRDSGASNVASPISDSITCAAGNYCVDLFATQAGRTLSASGGQTVIDTVGSQYAGSYLQGASSMGWSWTGGDVILAHIGIELVASGVAPNTIDAIGNTIFRVQPRRWR